MWAILPLLLVTSQTEGAPSRRVTLRYLGNEGFSLEAAGKTVLIDALQLVGTDTHGDLPEKVFTQMLKRKGPFEQIPLVLVSHPHADHFVPSVVSRFLVAHPESRLAGTTMVVGALSSEPQYSEFSGQLQEVTPAPGNPAVIESDGIEVRFFVIPHVANDLYHLPVIIHLIRFGGISIMHAGDAGLSAEQLASLGLRERGIDVAILPYWFFNQEGARELVEKYIGAKKVVTMRLPQGGIREAKKKIGASFPGIVFLTKPMEATRL